MRITFKILFIISLLIFVNTGCGENITYDVVGEVDVTIRNASGLDVKIIGNFRKRNANYG